MKTLDSDIRDTLQAAADAAAPEGYHEQLAARVAATLEVHDMRGVDMSGANGSGDRTQPPPQAVGAAGGRTTAKDEDSGLIDIKNMARSTRRRVTARHSTQSEVEESLLVSSRPSALRDVVLPEPGKEQPVELASATAAEAEPEPERKGGSSWMLAVAAIVLIGGGAAAFFATRGGDEGTKVAANEARGSAAAPAAMGAGDEAPTPDPAEPAEPGAMATDDGADEATADGDSAGTDEAAADDTDDTAGDEAPADDDGKGGAIAKAMRRDRDGKRGARDRSSKDEPKKADTHKADDGGKSDGKSDKADDAPTKPKGQDLDSLLDFAAGEDGNNKKSADGDKADKDKQVAAKKKLSRADVQQGMRSVTARVAACYERYKQPGTVKVKVTISNTGVITKATATGPFANTDTGACVAKAVSQASFPEFSGAPMSLTYPFLLQ